MLRWNSFSAPLPEAERKELLLSYYEDYLDAAGPENEARAIAELGSPEEVARKFWMSRPRQAVLPPRHPCTQAAFPLAHGAGRRAGGAGAGLLFLPALQGHPRYSRWSPFLLPRKFLLPLRKCQLRALNRRPWIPFCLRRSDILPISARDWSTISYP